jgi:hypothetical protein
MRIYVLFLFAISLLVSTAEAALPSRADPAEVSSTSRSLRTMQVLRRVRRRALIGAAVSTTLAVALANHDRIVDPPLRLIVHAAQKHIVHVAHK